MQPSAEELQAQILRELRQANNLAKNTNNTLEKAIRYDGSDDEHDHSHYHSGVEHGNDGQSRRSKHDGNSKANSKQQSESKARNQESPARDPSRKGKHPSPHRGHASHERKPCDRCIQNAKRHEELEKLRAQTKGGKLNFQEIEKELNQRVSDRILHQYYKDMYGKDG